MPFDLATNLTPKITTSGFASPSWVYGQRLFGMIVEIQVAPKPSGTNELAHIARDMKSFANKFRQTDSDNK